MAQSDKVADVSKAIERELEGYRRVKRELLLKLPMAVGETGADALISHAEEFGVLASLMAFKNGGALTVDDVGMVEIGKHLSVLLLATERIDRFAAEFNRLMQQRDHGHGPVMFLQDQSFRVGEMGYEPKLANGLGPIIERRKVKERNRGRDR